MRKKGRRRRRGSGHRQQHAQQQDGSFHGFHDTRRWPSRLPPLAGQIVSAPTGSRPASRMRQRAGDDFSRCLAGSPVRKARAVASITEPAAPLSLVRSTPCAERLTFGSCFPGRVGRADRVSLPLDFMRAVWWKAEVLPELGQCNQAVQRAAGDIAQQIFKENYPPLPNFARRIAPMQIRQPRQVLCDGLPAFGMQIERQEAHNQVVFGNIRRGCETFVCIGS